MQIRLLLAAILLSAVFFTACNQKHPPSPEAKMDRFIDSLMAQMTIEEKIGQLNLLPGYEQIVTGEATASQIGRKIKEGNVGAILNARGVEKVHELQRIAVEESRLGIPLMFGLDVIHGYRTVFPIPLGLAASFDMNLIEQHARIAAVEASAEGISWTFSPMVDLSRDPRWGRIAESAGECPFLGSQVAKAFVRGYQGNDLSAYNTLMACVKHFALYGASEAGLDYNTVDMSRIRMFNEYFPPYRAAIEAGAGSVMTAFNEVDGIPATGNRWLLTEVLRNKWGFDGVVLSDYTSVNEMIAHGMGDLQTVSALALNAGVELDMVGEGFLTTLKKSLDEGKVTIERIKEACRRVLVAKYRLGLFDDPYRYGDKQRAETEVFTLEHNRVARELAAQTFVLLKNQNQLLPIKKSGTIALIGPLANNRLHMAGTWSVAVDHSESVTVLEGFKEVAGPFARILYAKGSNITDDPLLDKWSAVRGQPSIDLTRTPQQMLNEAMAIARKSDVIVAVVGEAAEMSGESASRSDITLPPSQRRLLETLLQTGKPVVMVLFTGRPLVLTWEHDNIPAILNVWFGGTQSGNAVADVVFGNVNPSGKLPVTFPRSVGQIPIYYNHKQTGRPLGNDQWFRKFRTNYLDIPPTPLYPFGFGLSYTTFAYSDIKLNKTELQANDTLFASIELTNTGHFDGTEVVQLYTRQMVGSITRPVRELKGFQKVFLKAGETRNIVFEITTDDLMFYNFDLVYDWEPGEFRIMIGGSSAEVKEASVNWSE